jgi:hypothetical protein
MDWERTFLGEKRKGGGGGDGGLYIPGPLNQFSSSSPDATIHECFCACFVIG